MNRRTFLLQLVGAVSAGELLARLAPAPTGLELLIADGTSLFGISGSTYPQVAPDDYIVFANEEPYGRPMMEMIAPLEEQLHAAAEREFRRQAKLAGDKTMRDLLRMYGG